MNYTSFNTLCEMINGVSFYKIEQIAHANGKHVGIHLKNKLFPVSVNESEFNFIHNFIKDNNFKNGFELSTGTGISTIGIGTACVDIGGHLITMDSYYEDITGISQHIPVGNYNEDDIIQIKEKSICFKFISKIINNSNLKNTVQIEVGWSPTDSVKKIKERNKPLDFVFLDCPKNDDEFVRDIAPLIPLLNHKYAIFVHDTHTFTKKSFDFALEKFGTPMNLIYEYFENTPYYSKRHFPLGLITNI